MSELPEIDSKSSRAFPMMSRSVSVVANRLRVTSSSCLSRTISACSAEGRPTGRSAVAVNKPPSRACRQVVTNEEYNPSRRRYPPPSPVAYAAS